MKNKQDTVRQGHRNLLTMSLKKLCLGLAVFLTSVVIAYSINFYLSPDERLEDTVKRSMQAVTGYFQKTFSTDETLDQPQEDAKFILNALEDIIKNKYSISIDDNGFIMPFAPFHMTLTLDPEEEAAPEEAKAAQSMTASAEAGTEAAPAAEAKASQQKRSVALKTQQNESPEEIKRLQKKLQTIFKKIILIPDYLKIGMGRFIAIVFQKDFKVLEKLEDDEVALLKRIQEFNPEKENVTPHVSLIKWATNKQKKKGVTSARPIQGNAPAAEPNPADKDVWDDPWKKMKTNLNAIIRDAQEGKLIGEHQFKPRLTILYQDIKATNAFYKYPEITFDKDKEPIHVEQMTPSAFQSLFLNTENLGVTKLNVENLTRLNEATQKEELRPLLKNLESLETEVNALLQKIQNEINEEENMGFKASQSLSAVSMEPQVLTSEESNALRSDATLERLFPRLWQQKTQKDQPVQANKESEETNRQSLSNDAKELLQDYDKNKDSFTNIPTSTEKQLGKLEKALKGYAQGTKASIDDIKRNIGQFNRIITELKEKRTQAQSLTESKTSSSTSSPEDSSNSEPFDLFS